MKMYAFPDKALWEDLCFRCKIKQEDLTPKVQQIIRKVAERGDSALREYSRTFDKVLLKDIKVSEAEILTAQKTVPQEVQKAIQQAKETIEIFHKSQREPIQKIETAAGVTCWRKSVAIEKVGLYVPAGTAPLFSTVLMLGIPARLAGCKEIIICTPADKNGAVSAEILYAANLVGIRKIFKVGGAQAIAAMAHGTESISKVYKILGPGNQYVTKAKELVQLQGTAIDMPAGPSELLIIADTCCQPEFVAADLLSQAEHGKDSQVVLLTTCESIAQKIIKALEKQIQQLPRKDIAAAAIQNSFAVILKDIKQCFDFSNHYAPEHLIVASEKYENYADWIVNAGSVFLGNYSCESAGDYASGTNHTLPTNGYARAYSGVSLDSFVRKITFQNLSKKGLQTIGETIAIMAETEKLTAHKNAVTIRLESLKNV